VYLNLHLVFAGINQNLLLTPFLLGNKMKVISFCDKDHRGIGGIYRQKPFRRIKLYKTIANWLVRKNIKTIAGPVASGVIMAEGVATILTSRNRPIDIMAIPKRHYARHGYANGVKGSARGKLPILIVDDVFCSGSTIEHALRKYLDYETEGDLPEHLKLIEKGNIFVMFSSYQPGYFYGLERKPRLRKLFELNKVFKVVHKDGI
jgi:hypothetical protein